MSLPNALFSNDPTNIWWPPKKVGQDPVADTACVSVIQDLINLKAPNPSHIQASGDALANHFYFILHEVGEPDEGGGLAFTLTPVELWETQGQSWADEQHYEDVLTDFSEDVLPKLFKAKQLGIHPDSEWGAGCFVFQDLDSFEIFEHLSKCGFAWNETLQRQFDDLSEMGIMNEIKRCRAQGGGVNQKNVMDAFTLGLASKMR